MCVFEVIVFCSYRMHPGVRNGERKKQGGSEGGREGGKHYFFLCVRSTRCVPYAEFTHMCVCVCVRERETTVENVCVFATEKVLFLFRFRTCV